MIRPFLCLASLALAACGGPAPTGDTQPRGALNAAAGNGSAAVDAAADQPRRSYDPPVPKHLPAMVRMRIETEAGTIVVALDHARAPVTTTNFVRYADDHRFDGTYFYRAARNRFESDQGFIQGGIAHSIRLMLPPIPLESTTRTGLRHVDGAISMAHASPDTTMGDFVICVGAQPGLDAHPATKEPGYPAFGRVVEGMDVVRHILAAPTAGTAGGRPGEQILKPVRILRISRAG